MSRSPYTFQQMLDSLYSRINKRGPYPGKAQIKAHPEIKGTRCWEWTGSTTEQGYGTSNPASRLVGERLVHRAFFKLKFPKIKIRKKMLMHKCDNPACARPLHVIVGDAWLNAADRERKGRGNRQYTRRLSPDDVINIGSLYNRGVSCSKLSKKFGVSELHICRILVKLRNSL